jgi:hypothetical protein
VPRADPALETLPERQPAPHHPSFLRSTSTDKQIEQQHNSAFGDIQGRSSSQWLRRLSDKNPTKKHNSRIGRKLRDKIMKSFLGEANSAHEAPEATLAPAVGGIDITHVNKQIRLTIEVSSARQIACRHDVLTAP